MKPIKAAVLIAIAALLTVLFLYLRNTVTIIADGKETTVRSKNTSVGGLLKDYGVSVSTMDLLVPALDTHAPWHGTIRVTRVTEKTEKLTEFLPFIIRWSQKDAKNLRPVELQKGTQKIKYKTIKKIYHDNILAQTEVIRERTISKTVFRLALFNKDGSWQCIYDLSKAKKIKMLATAYYPGDPLAWGDGTVTYLGERMQRGIVAVDPRVIPLKTRVYVSGYGYGWAGDTGNMIKRKRIDLGVNNKQEEKDYMHVPVTVYILEKAESW